MALDLARPRLLTPRLLTPRTAAAALAALLLAGPGATSALAATPAPAPAATSAPTPAPTVVLDPAAPEVTALGADPVPQVGPGASVTVALPAPLGLGPGAAATFTASSGAVFSSASGTLPLTDAGGGRQRVVLPDASALGAAGTGQGSLVLGPLTAAVPGARTTELVQVAVAITDSGAASADVAVRPVVEGAVPGVPVAAGGAVSFTLPESSRLSAFGVDTLAGFAFELIGAGSDGQFLPLVPALSGDGRTAAVTVPAGTAPGRYSIGVASESARYEVRVVAGPFSVSAPTAPAPVAPPVTAAPTVPAPVAAAPVRNAGLRSNTGWEDRAAPADGDGDPWLAVGGGAALVTAGLLAAVVLRPSRRGTGA